MKNLTIIKNSKKMLWKMIMNQTSKLKMKIMIYLKTYTNQGDGDENNNNQGEEKIIF